MKRKYDAIIVIDPDKDEKEIEATRNKIEKIFKEHEIEIEQNPDIERKELYHPIKKRPSALFLRYKITCEPQKIEDLKMAIKHEEEILRYTFWRRDE